MHGGLISWDLSHTLVDTNTYYWLWIMFQNGVEAIPAITCDAKVVIYFRGLEPIE